jgi:hypothetical protein
VNASSIGSLFTFAAALVAAVAGDAVVEGLSNANLFWHGNYTDRSSLDLLPVLLLAVTALLAGVCWSMMRAARVRGISIRSLVLSTAHVLEPSTIRRLLPAVAIVQIIALYLMETTEQLAVFGRPLGGTIWLGGPVAVSLTIHLAFAVICAFALSTSLRTLAIMLARVVDCILGQYQRVTRGGNAIRLTRGRVACVFEPIVISSIVGRGPP